MRVATAFLFALVLFSVYSYCRKSCRKAYSLISLGILGAYAWLLVEQKLFLNLLFSAISSEVVAAQSVRTQTAKEHVWQK